MKNKMNKKGMQLNEAAGAVIALTVIAVLVIVSIYLFSSLGYSLMTPDVSATSANESLAKATDTGVNLAVAKGLTDPVCGQVTQLINGTTQNIGVGNVTVRDCKVYNATDLSDYTTNLKYTYSYTYRQGTSASNASETSVTNFTGYPALIGLVGTIIFLALVIGVLIASFAFGRRGV